MALKKPQIYFILEKSKLLLLRYMLHMYFINYLSKQQTEKCTNHFLNTKY